MADDWNNIDEELKKLEDEFSGDDNVMRELAAPSAADYWKKRLEEEKELWAKIIETKEEEKKALQAKLSKQEKDLDALKQEIKKIGEGYAEEAQAWQERFKTKETELLLEKERVLWDEKFRGLQYENRILQEEFDRSRKYYEEEKTNTKNANKKEMEELLSAQNVLIENLDALERELGEYEASSESYRKEKERLGGELALSGEQLKNVSEKYARSEREKEELNARIGYLNESFAERRDGYLEYLSCVTDYFSGRVRDNLGTILGIINYCFRRIRLHKLAKKQLIIVSDVVEKILQSVDKMTELIPPEKLELQEFSAVRLFAKLGDSMEASQLPLDLKIKANYPGLKDALSPYAERAVKAAVVCKPVPVGSILNLEITLQGRISVDPEFIRLRKILFLHEWSLSTAFDSGSNNTKMSIQIPAFKTVEG